MTTVKIKEHSGQVHITEVENYNAAKTFKDIQSVLGGTYMVLIGDVVLDSRSINSISVVVPEPEQVVVIPESTIPDVEEDPEPSELAGYDETETSQ